MRLIDADKLEAYGTTVPKNCNAEDYLCGARDVLEHIDSMPTVEAIPIGYIIKQIVKLERSKGQSYHAICYRHLIEEWEMENERKEE